MSYLICVRVDKKNLYLPVKWNKDNGMMALYKKKWQKVIDTFEKNKYNHTIFELVKEGE